MNSDDRWLMLLGLFALGIGWWAPSMDCWLLGLGITVALCVTWVS